MHLEYASACDSGSPGAGEPELLAPLPVALLELEVVAVLDPEVVGVPARAALDVELVELATFATLGLPELPPHPATRTPLTSPAAASRRARGDRSSLFGWLLSRIGSPSGVRRVCASVLPGARLREGFAARGHQLVPTPWEDRCNRGVTSLRLP